VAPTAHRVFMPSLRRCRDARNTRYRAARPALPGRDFHPLDRASSSVPRRRDSGGTLLTHRAGGSFIHTRRWYPRNSVDGFGDSADATRRYPEDSTDETNSLNLI
jgi:hypothetical protein